MSSVNLNGQLFGYLTVCGDVSVNDNGRREYPCTCFRRHGVKICGKVVRVLETDLLEGNVLSCGCDAELEENDEKPSVRQLPGYVDSATLRKNDEDWEGTFSGGRFLSANKMDS